MITGQCLVTLKVLLCTIYVFLYSCILESWALLDKADLIQSRSFLDSTMRSLNGSQMRMSPQCPNAHPKQVLKNMATSMFLCSVPLPLCLVLASAWSAGSSVGSGRPEAGSESGRERTAVESSSSVLLGS